MATTTTSKRESQKESDATFVSLTGRPDHDRFALEPTISVLVTRFLILLQAII